MHGSFFDYTESAYLPETLVFTLLGKLHGTLGISPYTRHVRSMVARLQTRHAVISIVYPDGLVFRIGLLELYIVSTTLVGELSAPGPHLSGTLQIYISPRFPQGV